MKLNQESKLITNVASVQALRTAARDACLIRKNYPRMTTAPKRRQQIVRIYSARFYSALSTG
ncbi:hypothetical protein ACPWML_26990, partial [Pandoraea pneumonica]|uniref:hypothetical protein n=1 Tax=Pandoraea pneumonica TaxID=2508299 RepID=UPI003CF42CE0